MFLCYYTYNKFLFLLISKAPLSRPVYSLMANGERHLSVLSTKDCLMDEPKGNFNQKLINKKHKGFIEKDPLLWAKIILLYINFFISCGLEFEVSLFKKIVTRLIQ
jgi:hypothetical protein